MQETLEGQVENLFMPINNFFEVGENVFNGNIAEIIDTYNRQTYNLGAIMRDGIEKPTFDIKLLCVCNFISHSPIFRCIKQIQLFVIYKLNPFVI